MTKPKHTEAVVVQPRAALRVGELFKFSDGRVYYAAVESPNDRLRCDLCAFKGRKNRRYCASVFCTPTFRDDGQFVYFTRVK